MWLLAQLCWHSHGHGFAEGGSGALQAPTAVHAWGQPGLGFAVPALLQAGVPGASSTGVALWPGASMWLQYPLPGQAGCQGRARRCWEHVMPSLLRAGGERERNAAWVHGTGGATLRSHRHGPWYPPVPLHKPPPCTSCPQAELPVASPSPLYQVLGLHWENWDPPALGPGGGA